MIVGKEKALLFDTGYGVADLKEAVEEITKLRKGDSLGESNFP